MTFSAEIKTIQKIQTGKTELFVDLYNTYVEKIYNFTFYKVGDKSIAEDITSETFLKALDKISSFRADGKHKFSSRLYMIASNLTVDYFRDQSKQQQYDRLDELGEANDIVTDISHRQQLETIMHYIDSLGADKKEIFVMRIRNNMSYDEIAEITGKSTANCKTIFSRTMKSVHERFGAEALLLLMMIPYL